MQKYQLKISSKTIALCVGVAAMVFSISAIVRAWTDAPAGIPPTCPSGYPGCDVPVNVSSSAQAKAGALTVGSVFTVAGSGGDALVIQNGGDLKIYNSNNSGSALLYCDTGGELKTSGNLTVGGTGTFNCINLGGVTECSWPTGDGGTGYWTQSDSGLYPTNAGWNVAIGTTNPAGFRLNVSGATEGMKVSGGSRAFYGLATAPDSYGIYGESTGDRGVAVYGRSHSNTGSIGVLGVSTPGTGVVGWSSGTGTKAGVLGQNFADGIGVYGYSTNGTGVRGFSQNGWAGYFQGDVYIYGDIGIGTTNPGTELDVDGRIHATDDICTDLNGGKCLSTVGDGGGVSYWTQTDSSLYPNNTGWNLAIGTTDPEGYRLNIKGGIFGIKVSSGSGYGIYASALSAGGVGVRGEGQAYGVTGQSNTGRGVNGITGSRTNPGVYGYNAYTENLEGGPGVYGYSYYGIGVQGGTYKGKVGVYGSAHNAEAYGWQPMWGFFTPDKAYVGLKLSIGEIEPDADADLYVGDGTGRDLSAPPGWIPAGDGYANLVIESKTAGKFPLIKMKNTLGNWQIWASDDDLVFRRGGAATAMLIDGETLQVGINTDNPRQRLSVNGDIGVWDSKAVYFYTGLGETKKGYVGPGRSADLSLISQTSSSWLRIGANNANISFWANGGAASNDSPQVFISPTGNLEAVGYVKGSQLCIGSDCRSAWPTGGGGVGYWTQTDSSLYPNNTSWNIGIGTTSPNRFAALDVYGRVQAQEFKIKTSNAEWIMDIDGSGRFFIEDTLGLPRLVIEEATGKVGIATTPTEQLDVNGLIKGRSGLCIGDDCRRRWPTEVNTIIQSGNQAIPNYTCGAGAYYSGRVDFPTPFSSVPNVTVGPKGFMLVVGEGATLPVASLGDITATGFDFYWSTNDYGRHCENPKTLYWMAIGQK